MNKRNIQELIMLVRSCKNNLDKRYKGKFDKDVDNVCMSFCKKHNITITHGNAYKELRHKSYYYINKNIDALIYDFVDLYDLYKCKIITGSDVVNRMLKIKERKFKV